MSSHLKSPRIISGIDRGIWILLFVKMVFAHFVQNLSIPININTLLMAERGFITVIGCNKCGKCDRVCPIGAIELMDGIARIIHEKCAIYVCVAL